MNLKEKFIPPNSLNTSVLLLVFNRLDTTKQVFEAIRQAKPPRLYIASDGPRDAIENEHKKVECVRNFILGNVDWECEVKTLFRDKNIGCKLAVSGAITWFFEHEEQGIILEDDCLPSKSFFWYCDELLEKYKDNHKIMHIAGSTYVEKPNNHQEYDYHFARVGGIWGWASWRRSWNLYELEMESYPLAIEENIFDDLFIGEDEIKKLYLDWFKNAYGNTNTWDYQWTYTKIINNSINIMPSKNLIKNIGHGSEQATHTTGEDKKYSDMMLNELNFPLKHPKFFVIDREFNYLNYKFITQMTFKQNILKLIKKILPKFIVDYLKKFKH
tara:strand:+ start:2278 stop:3261 length:984 start_codon:yes stop_codon:yes gene_type:complete